MRPGGTVCGGAPAGDVAVDILRGDELVEGEGDGDEDCYGEEESEDAGGEAEPADAGFEGL